jgi:hypothetical protein
MYAFELESKIDVTRSFTRWFKLKFALHAALVAQPETEQNRRRHNLSGEDRCRVRDSLSNCITTFHLMICLS